MENIFTQNLTQFNFNQDDEPEWNLGKIVKDLN